jgi:hypothetical protein
MTDRDILIELLAIKLYEHDHQGLFPPRSATAWMQCTEEDREIYRDKIKMAGTPQHLYEEES